MEDKNRTNLLERIETIKANRNGKFYNLNHLPYAPRFNNQFLDDVNYKELTDSQLQVFHEAITTGVERAGNYE